MKFFLKLALFVLSFCLIICTNSNAKISKRENLPKKLKIVTTIFPQYDFIREIAKDKVELSMLLHPGTQAHSFEPTPSDIIKIKNCDIFVYVGGENEDWVKDKILASIDTKGKTVLALLDLVKLVEEEIIEGMQEEQEDESKKSKEEKEYDEHVWTSPKNAKIIVKALTQALSKKDSENSQYYKQNMQEYLKNLDALDIEFKNIVKNAKRKTIIFGDRFPFRYFADDYKLKYYAAFAGCSTESDASAATISFLIKKVSSERIPVVFHIELSNQKIADAICEQTRTKKLLMNSCHNVTKKEFEKGISYLDLMKTNVENLKEALQ
ncbi:MAG: metal ABC transporter substrate-binding protein [Elusimicrobiota bacterium]|nr:metal ABC transporter substrate-binding protein [Elusimicrobiota bacterium]